MIVLQLCSLFLVDDLGVCRFLDLLAEVLGADQPFLARLPQPALQRGEFDAELQGLFQQADGVAGFDRRVRLLAEPLAGFAGCRHQFDDLVDEFVGRCGVSAAAREDENAQERRHPAVRQIPQERMQRLLRLVHKCAHGPLDERQVGRTAPLVLEMLQYAGREVDRTEHVAEAR